MGRKTRQNLITSPEKLAQVLPENKRLLDDFMTYLKSIQRSPNTIVGYKNDLEIFFVWNLENNSNKPFVKCSKRDILAYQNWLLHNNENSPARVRRLKSTLSSMSSFLESVLDDEFPDFRSIVKKIENPVNQPVREKTVLSDEDVQRLLDALVGKKEYEKACLFALAAASGRRKSELVRFKVSHFNNENIVYGSLYKTHEKLRTKGRALGKYIFCYVLVNRFKPYFDLWMNERTNNAVESEWLFPDPLDLSKHREPSSLNSWTDSFSRILGVHVYLHAMRHYFTTALKRAGIPDDVIQTIVGWDSPQMVNLYSDISVDDELGKYFSDGDIIGAESKSLSDL